MIVLDQPVGDSCFNDACIKTPLLDAFKAWNNVCRNSMIDIDF